MNKPFDENKNILLEIKKVEEIGLEEEKKEEMKEIEEIEPEINFNHNEIFTENESKETIEEEPEEKEEPKPKRGRGKRGKDKKPRKRPVVSEKRLKSLEKAREKSRQVREAKKLEKERLKKEIEIKAAQNIKKDRKIKKPEIKKPEIKPKKTIPQPNYEQFFNMMEKYEEYKAKKNNIKKIIPKVQSHPASKKPEIINPYDNCFNYGLNRRRNKFYY